MTRTAPNPLLIAFFLLFAFGVLGISLMSASVSNTSRWDVPFSARKIRFSSQIIPGNILYPFSVLRDRVALFLMTTADQCRERLELARERLNQAEHLLELGDTQLALETIVKGQRYLADAAEQCQKNKLSLDYQESVRGVIDIYKHKLTEMKQHYPDTDRAVIDQLLTENEALLTTLQQKN